MLDHTRKTAIECMFIAHAALNQYVAAHDRMLKQQGTFGSMFRNLFGRGPDFGRLLAEASTIVNVWADLISGVAEQRRMYYNFSTPTECRFYDCLSPWLVAVHRATQLLEHRQRLIWEKSNGTQVNWNEYNQVEDEYAKAVMNYQAFGLALNDAVEALKSGAH